MSEDYSKAKARARLQAVKDERADAKEVSSAAQLYGRMRHSPEMIRELFRTGRYPYKNKIRRNVYDHHKGELQVELLKVQNWVKQTGQKVVVICEGRDAAGKGGVIRRITGALPARSYQLVPIAAPTAEEKRYHYLWRFWRCIPRQGRVTVFDRSWYGRVLVERIEGFLCRLLHVLGSRDDWRCGE